MVLEEESFMEISSSNSSNGKLILQKDNVQSKKKISSQQIQSKLSLGFLNKLVDQLTDNLKKSEEENKQSPKGI